MWIDDVFTGSSRVIHRDALPMPPCRPITPTRVRPRRWLLFASSSGRSGPCRQGIRVRGPSVQNRIDACSLRRHWCGSSRPMQHRDGIRSSGSASKQRRSASTPSRPYSCKPSPETPPHSPRSHRGPEEQPPRSDTAPMPPSSATSQTASAQELRETARQSICSAPQGSALVVGGKCHDAGTIPPPTLATFASPASPFRYGRAS